MLLLNTCSVRDAAEQKAIGKAGQVLAQAAAAAPTSSSGSWDAWPRTAGRPARPAAGRGPDRGHPENSPRARLSQESPGRPRSRGAHGPDDRRHRRGGGFAERDPRPPRADEPPVEAFVSIQQGCDMACSFCIVPKTRGRRALEADGRDRCGMPRPGRRGVREVTLLGQIVTSYGRATSFPRPRGGPRNIGLRPAARAHP